MNIQDLLDAGINVNITVTPADLEEFAISIINKMKEEKPHHEKYLHPDEVARICDVTKNTLWRWDKTGYLKAERVGRRLFYKKSDVDKLLNGEKS